MRPSEKIDGLICSCHACRRDISRLYGFGNEKRFYHRPKDTSRLHLSISLSPISNKPVCILGGCVFSSSLPNLTTSPLSLIASTARPRLWSSLTSTRKEAGILGSSIGSPLTIASYVLTRPW